MILIRLWDLILEAEAAKVRPRQPDQKKWRKRQGAPTPGTTEYETGQGGWG